MMLKPVMLKARQALPSTQAKIVTDLHKRVRKKIMALLLVLTNVDRKVQSKGKPMKPDDAQMIFDKWIKLQFLRENLKFLERQWKKLGVAGDCPVYTEKERVSETYDYIVKLMTDYGITSDKFTTTHVLPVFDDVKDDVEEEAETEPVSTETEKVYEREPGRGDPLDWSMSILDDDELGTVRQRIMGQKKLYEIRQSVRNQTAGLYDSKGKSVISNPHVTFSPAFTTPMNRRSTLSSTLPASLFKQNRGEDDLDNTIILAKPSTSRVTTKIDKVMQAGDDTILDAISEAMHKMKTSGTSGSGSGGDKDDNSGQRKNTDTGQQSSFFQSGDRVTPRRGAGGGGDPDDSDDPDDPRGGGGGRGGRLPQRGNRGYVPPGLNIQIPQRGVPLFEKFNRDDYKDMEPFDGDYLDFMRFFHTFIDVVDQTDCRESMKYARLIGKLDARSKHLIKNVDSTQYDRALSILVEEYTDISKVISHIYARANAVPLVRSLYDVQGISDMVHSIQSILLLFEHYGLDIGYEAEILKLFAGKMPGKLSDAYCLKNAGKPPSLKRYCLYLEAELKGAHTFRMLDPGSELRRANARNDFPPRGPFPRSDWKGKRDGKGWGGTANATLTAEEQMTHSEAFQSTSRGSVNAASTSTGLNGNGKDFRTKNGFNNVRDDRPKPPCSKCKDPEHSILYCRQATPAERKELVRTLGLCFLCLRKGHIIEQCSINYKCVKCNGRHNVRLCEGHSKKPDCPVSTPQQVNFVENEWNPEDYNEDLRLLYG